MAFVAHTTRESNRVGARANATGSRIGPGSYESRGALRRSKPSYAPFGSTDNRSSGGTPSHQTVTPGPGSYTREEQTRVMPCSNTFKSKTQRRIQAKPSVHTPGPGAYEEPRSGFKTPSKFQLQQQARTQKTDPAGVKWVRVPTAPSIPASNQAFGYEEGSHGELMMQKPVHVGHSGRYGDSVGPGDYSPSTKIKPAKRAVDFGRSQVPQRADPAKMYGFGNPGPGQYQATPTASTLIPPKQSSIFQSSVKKGTVTKKPNDNPGPGAYSSKGYFGDQKTETHLQFFGSTSRRFDAGPREEQRKFGGPGPGSYRGAEPTGFTTSVSLASPTQHEVGFASTSSRFQPKRVRKSDTSETRGPGSYEAKSMAGELSKKLASRAGVFGSTTKRFHSIRSDAVPGPGTYKGAEVPDGEAFVPQNAPSIAKKPGSVFSSITNRTLDKKPMDVPPPGTYNVGSKWTTGSGAGLIASGGKRFEQPRPADQTPGPGRYQSKGALKPAGSNRKMIMQTTVPRFENTLLREQTEKNPVPGPGSYDTEYLYGNLNKPTFNMAIADASAQ